MTLLAKINNFNSLTFSRKKQYLTRVFRIIIHSIFKFEYKKSGHNVYIGSPLFITKEHITLGSNINIWNGVRLEGVAQYAGCDFSPDIIIEDAVSFQQRCTVVAAGTLKIGEGTLISYDVMITDVDHLYMDINCPIGSQKLRHTQTTIGKNCFIGSGSKILAGTRLGNHCIVGANTVVRGVFPPYSVICGNPARIVKRYNVEKKEWQKLNL
ncbi:acyltransferase [Vibrio owensii]|uniref:acyltransferase n=1 Tax=Vibrio owensii TaxID=696485 RepID=UPI0009B890E3|nr:acyltransferase [Vibrio owensii]